MRVESFVPRSLRSAIFAAAMLVGGSRAGAQSCTVNAPPGTCSVTTGATLVVGKVVQLTLAGTATTFATPTDANYTAGYIDATGQMVTVQSNTAVAVTVAARTTVWTATNTATGVSAWTAKPSTDLGIAFVAAGPFTPLTTTGFTVTTNGPTNAVNVPIVYRVALNWAKDTPGQYSLDVVYTVTAP